MPIDVTDDTAAGDGAELEPPAIAAARHAMAFLGLHPDCELSVAFVDDDAMARLHEDWMDLPGPTDVLSFPMDELRVPADGEVPAPGVLGDLVLAPAFVGRQAADHRVSVTDEVQLLTVHGLLHLVGFDHAEPDEEREMFDLQTRILADLRGADASAVPR